ncbi:hypothetical protein V8D89_008984 [Ganoderma adspersum]
MGRDGLSYVSAFVGGAVADHGVLIIYDTSTYAGLVSSAAFTLTLHIVKMLSVERYFCPRRFSVIYANEGVLWPYHVKLDTYICMQDQYLPGR